MEEKEIKGLLKQKFEHYEEDPGADLWLAIESEIHPGRRRVVAWWMYAAVAASVAILFFSLFLLLNQPDHTSHQPEVAETDSVVVPLIPQPLMTEDVPAPSETLPAVKELPVQKTSEGREVHHIAPKREKDSTKEFAKPPQKQVDENFAALNIETLNNPGFSPLTPVTLPEKAPAKVEIPTNKRNQPATPSQLADSKHTLNFNDLTVEDAVSFASNTIEKWKNSPIDVYQEKGPDGETKTYQVDFLNLRITKKTHKRVVKQL
ncbi:MAG: hypothetical protein R3C61_18905 [Bacteroidia bacterium]